MNDLLMIVTGLTALGIPLALVLRSGKPAAAEGPRVMEG